MTKEHRKEKENQKQKQEQEQKQKQKQKEKKKMVDKVNLLYRISNESEKPDIKIDCSEKWVRENGTHTKLLCGFDSDDDPGEGTIGLVLEGIGKTESLVKLLKTYMKKGEIAELRKGVIDSDIAGLYNFAHFNQMDGLSELFNNARELVIDKFMKMLFDKTMENRGEELHENLEEFVTNLNDLVIGNEIINTIFEQAYSNNKVHILRIILYPRKQLSRVMENNKIDPTVHSLHLARAAMGGHTEIVRMVLAWEGEDGRRLDPTVGEINAIELVSIFGYTEIARMLLAWEGPGGRRVDPTDAFRNATVHGHIEIVRMFLAWKGQDGRQFDDFDMSIRIASGNGYTEIVRLLLAWEGATRAVGPWSSQYTYNDAFEMASKNGHTEIVRMFLAWEGPGGHRVYPTSNGNRPFRYARKNGHSEIVSMFLAWEGPDDQRVSNDNPYGYQLH